MTLFVALAGKPERASQAIGSAAIAIAVVAVIGWRAGLPLLSIWGSGYFAIGPFPVLMLAAFGLALVHTDKDSRFAFADRDRA